jgi:hypothetical protein
MLIPEWYPSPEKPVTSLFMRDLGPIEQGGFSSYNAKKPGMRQETVASTQSLVHDAHSEGDDGSLAVLDHSHRTDAA